MKKNYLVPLLAIGLTIVSCSADEDMEVLQPDETSAQVDLTKKVVFPSDENAKDLPSSNILKVRDIIKASGPEIGHQKAYYKLTDEQYKEIKAFTDDLVTGIEDETEVYQTIFNWICKNISYDYTDNEPYSVFKSKKAICQGYANLMHVMLRSQGIPVLIVNGMLSNVGGHAWNYVYVGGKWKVSDPTNSSQYDMLKTPTYSHLIPFSIDARLFESDEYVFTFKESKLNLAKVKKADTDFAVPYSVAGFKVTSFSPDSLLPANISTLIVGDNIESLGEEYLGLRENSPSVQSIHIDPNNKNLHAYAEVAYYKWGDGFTIAYVPSAIKRVELPPVEVMGKNYFYKHNNIEELVFTKETKKIEAYAVEGCPRLRVAYVPEGVEIDPQAFYNVGQNFQIIREDCTGIEHVKM